MKNKVFLFPHKIQTVGWWVLLMSFILIPLIPFSLLCFNSSGQVETARVVASCIRTVASVMSIFISIGLFLIAFSQEKYEDEYIKSIRMKSVMMAAIIGFICYLFYSIYAAVDMSCIIGNAVDNIANGYDLDSVLNSENIKRIASDTLLKNVRLQNFSGVFYMFIYYEVIFRINLCRLKKSTDDAK